MSQPRRLLLGWATEDPPDTLFVTRENMGLNSPFWGCSSSTGTQLQPSYVLCPDLVSVGKINIICIHFFPCMYMCCCNQQKTHELAWKAALMLTHPALTKCFYKLLALFGKVICNNGGATWWHHWKTVSCRGHVIDWVMGIKEVPL